MRDIEQILSITPLYFSKEELSDSRPSWNWQAPTPFYSKSFQSEATKEDEITAPTSRQLQAERPSSVQSNFITKTTVYDPQTGGFITSVSTDTADHGLPVKNTNPIDKLILSQNSYNTLTRKMKEKGSYSNLSESISSAASNNPKIIDPRGSVSGSLVNHSNQYVTSIAVVSRHGSLLALSSSTSDITDDSEIVDVKHHEVVNRGTRNGYTPYLINANNDFVANIQVGASKARKSSRGLTKKGFGGGPDSLVTSTLLDLTSPRPEEQERRAKLSGYILDEEGENSFDNQMVVNDSNERVSDDFEQPQLSAMVLDKGDELNDLYRTISRKRILSKVHCANFHLHTGMDNHHGECNRKHSNMFGNEVSDQDDTSTHQRVGNLQKPIPRPLAKIFDRLHGLNPTENTYVSLTGDSVYQSLQNPSSSSDDNNNGFKAEVLSACPVLVANILATHAETFKHATAQGCADCFDYANSVGYALPYLEPRNLPDESQCKVHGHVSDKYSFHHNTESHRIFRIPYRQEGCHYQTLKEE